MKYKIYKEKKPIKTVKKIIKLLKNKLNINLQEEVYTNINDVKSNFASLRIKLLGINSLGTNGKGTNINNAKASAYGEFMERIQNQTWISCKSTSFKFAPDELFFNIEELKNNIFSKYLNDNKLLEKMAQISAKTVNNSILHEEIPSNSYLMLPFFNIKDKNVYNLPYKIIRYMQITTGMTAGNTKEEALVQGISEICERYAIKEIISKNISLPNIPKEFYIKYENIKKIIEAYEESGYKIYIKDASLNKNIPTVCLVVQDDDNEIFYLSFGAHPSLPVAIERTLTEFCQGSSKILKKEILNSCNILDNEDINYIVESMSMLRTGFKYTSRIKNQFITENESYKFSNSAWIKNNIFLNNKKILKFLLENIRPITNNDIYIRDVGFLDFPAFYIFIPTMSVLYEYNIEKADKELNLIKWIELKEENLNEEENYSIESLKDALEIKENRRLLLWKGKISSITNEHLLLLCSIVQKDKEKINLYAEEIIKKTTEEKYLTLLNIIKDYYSADSDNLIIEKLSEKYSQKDIENFIKFKDQLTYTKIKELIIKNKNFKREEIIQKLKELNSIREKLAQEYNKNMPKQYELKRLFKFVKTEI